MLGGQPRKNSQEPDARRGCPRARGEQILVKVYPDRGARGRRGGKDHSFVREWLSQYNWGRGAAWHTASLEGDLKYLHGVGDQYCKESPLSSWRCHSLSGIRTLRRVGFLQLDRYLLCFGQSLALLREAWAIEIGKGSQGLEQGSLQAYDVL